MARLGLRWVAVAAFGLTALSWGAATATASTLGSNLFAPADASLCPTSLGGLEASCAVTQLRLAHKDATAAGLDSDRTGVLAHWWVVSGPASPATSDVHLRLRVLDGTEPVSGAATSYMPLPLDEPGLHAFPARLPIESGQRVSLDVSVRGSGDGTASAPIAHSESGVGEVAEWVPSLGPQAPSERLRDTELLLRASVELDRDRDGWGDGSQDGCRFDPRRRSSCLPDEVAPAIRIAFARRQDFVARYKVLLTVRPSEYANISTNGTLGTHHTAWGLLGSEAWLKTEQSAVLPVYVNGDPLKAAKRNLAAGGNPYVTAVIYAFDASGNRARRAVRVSLPAG